MPHAELTRAIGQLFYRTNVRRRFFESGHPPCDGLSDSDLQHLRAINRARLERVVSLHRSDIWRNWYQPFVPATWTALCTALDLDSDQVVELLTDSPSFDLRINDDSTCSALSSMIDQLLADQRLDAAPWLPELLQYELALCDRWGACQPLGERQGESMLFRFTWEVDSIWQALSDGMFPEDEEQSQTWIEFRRTSEGFTEQRIDPDALELVDGTDDSADGPIESA